MINLTKESMLYLNILVTPIVFIITTLKIKRKLRLKKGNSLKDLKDRNRMKRNRTMVDMNLMKNKD